MKVAELMTLLKNYPADMEVLIPSYEEGFDPVTSCREGSVGKVENKDWYNGVYDVVEGGAKAVLICSIYTRAELEDVEKLNAGIRKKLEALGNEG